MKRGTPAATFSTGYLHKHAERLLRGASRKERSRPRPERRLHDEAAREALILLWEASDRICGPNG